MKHKCSACGHEDEIGAGELAASLGAIRTPKREAAWKANGERLKKMYANAKKVTAAISGGVTGNPTWKEIEDAKVKNAGIGYGIPDSPIPPKPTTLEEKKARAKAALAGIGAVPMDETLLSATPAAPFDLSIEGEPHRVRQIGKKLMLVYLGPDGENPIRPIGEGELEQLWTKRIIK